ncbi:MAG: IS66 family transposase [Bacillota bacterium]|nr:IS66 family transposase [Bacillota bacterium]
MTYNLMKCEEIPAILDSLKPVIDSIIDPNVKIIINTLLKIITVLQTENEELKEKLNTNSKNSSKPPSSESFKKKPKQKKKSKRKQGAQPGHKGVFRELLPTKEVDRVEVCKLSKRCDCGSRIKSTENYRRHQVHELPRVKAIVTEYQLHSGVCFACGKIHQAELPAGVPKGMLGPIAMAKIVTLTGDYRMSKRNVTFLFDDFYGLNISAGTVSNAEKIVSAALEKPVEEAKQFVPQQSRVNSDETRHAECGNKMWTWVFIASLVAIFLIQPSRGAKVVKNFLGEGFKGILNTDRWSAYTWLAAIYRQLCWAHLQRDFKKISERSGKSGRIGEELLACTKKMFTYWGKVKDGTVNRKQFKKLMDPIRKRVELLLEEGKRCGNKKTVGTCKQLLKLKEALWTFVEKEGVEPTNNLAEQIIRRIVIWRKTSFGTQSARGTLYIERIMTVVATCKMQKRNVLDFVTNAVSAHLGGSPAPSLLPTKINENTLLKLA